MAHPPAIQRTAACDPLIRLGLCIRSCLKLGSSPPRQRSLCQWARLRLKRLLKNRSDRRWERQAAGSKAARRRHSGRATSRQANAGGGDLPPQPAGRQGVAALGRRWSPLPMRCGIAFKAPPRPEPQDPDAAAAPVLQQPSNAREQSDHLRWCSPPEHAGAPQPAPPGDSDPEPPDRPAVQWRPVPSHPLFLRPTHCSRYRP
jgi:hypothetical protein